MTRIWRSKRPGRSSAGSSWSSMFEARDHHHVVAIAEAVELHQELVQRLVLLARDVLAAGGAHGVELVDEDDRRGRLAAPGGTAAGCGRRRGPRTSPRTRPRTGRRRSRSDSLATALASSVLPVPGGPCSRMPFGTRAPSLRKRLGSRMNSTTSRSSSLASSAPATSSQRTELYDCGLDLLRLGARHVRTAKGAPRAARP